jgi:hypothetical protein
LIENAGRILVNLRRRNDLELRGAEAHGYAGGLQPGGAHLETCPAVSPGPRRRHEGPVRAGAAAAGEGREQAG